MKPTTALFNIYRYQILPTTQIIQTDVRGEIKSIEELRAKKNLFFKRVLDDLTVLFYNRGEINLRPVHHYGDIWLFQMNVKRKILRKTKDFKKEALDNWPTIYFLINNHPDEQKILIQQGAGFVDTKTAIDMLANNLNKKLMLYSLSVHFEPIYDRKKFWDLVQKHQGKITQAKFELISPNMANISQGLKLDLQSLNRATNTQKTELVLKSDESAALTLSPEDAQIASLVDYSSQGGGNISIKIKGLSKRIQTAHGKTEKTIDEIEILGYQGKDLVKILEKLLK